MKPGTSFVPTAGFSVLVIGDAGAGKTRLAMSFPNPGFIDCDGNLASAVRVSEGKKFFYSSIFADDSGREIPEVERWTRAVTETKLMLANPDVHTIVVDSLGPLCAWGLLYAENELKKSGIDIRKEYLAKYNSFIPLISGYITMLKIGGKFVIVNAHQIIDKAELMGTLSYVIDMPGRMASNLGRQFNDVWVMSATADPASKVGARYEIRTKPTGFHVNPKTSLELPPVTDVSGKTPREIWSLIAPKLPGYVPATPLPTANAVATQTTK